MRIGLIGDIHGNYLAFQAVMNILEKENLDGIYCTGDLVGYGPQPAECIDLAMEKKIVSVLGNHDHYVTLLVDSHIDKLRPDVQETIRWTQQHLDIKHLRWLSQLPKSLEFQEFSLIHGSYGPKPWSYLINERRITRNFRYQKHNLAFCGHSHMPLLAIQKTNSPPSLTFLKNCIVPEDDKVIINIGSVGQPRDYDPRACCVIFDFEDRSLRVIRTPYDIATVQDMMKKENMPEKFYKRLEKGI